jgi:hypothetical protein
MGKYYSATSIYPDFNNEVTTEARSIPESTENVNYYRDTITTDSGTQKVNTNKVLGSVIILVLVMLIVKFL